MSNNRHYQDILKMFGKLTYSHGAWEIFYDLMVLSATCISNTVDIRHFAEREKLYLETIKKYTPEQQVMFADMFAMLVLALEHEYQTRGFIDVLGELFHELNLHDKYRGQFFTSQNICTMMGRMVFSENDKSILEQGYISVSEPACGSGAMLLGFAQAVIDSGYNHSQQILVSAVDIDIKCVYMCYIQLSLYGIPAVVTHGNALTLEEWSHWYTPVHILNGWRCKKPINALHPIETIGHKQTLETTPTEIILPAPNLTSVVT